MFKHGWFLLSHNMGWFPDLINQVWFLMSIYIPLNLCYIWLRYSTGAPDSIWSAYELYILAMSFSHPEICHLSFSCHKVTHWWNSLLSDIRAVCSLITLKDVAIPYIANSSRWKSFTVFVDQSVNAKLFQWICDNALVRYTRCSHECFSVNVHFFNCESFPPQTICNIWYLSLSWLQ